MFLSPFTYEVFGIDFSNSSSTICSIGLKSCSFGCRLFRMRHQNGISQQACTKRPLRKEARPHWTYSTCPEEAEHEVLKETDHQPQEATLRLSVLGAQQAGPEPELPLLELLDP